VLSPMPAAYTRTERRLLRLFFEELKEEYKQDIQMGDLEAAHELLAERLRLLKEVLREQEWSKH